MFETSGDDAWMLSAFAARAPRPFTSSLFSTIYQYMPNNTDLTRVQAARHAGAELRLHREPDAVPLAARQPGDVSPASLQHHGDNALAAVRGLAEADLANAAHGAGGVLRPVPCRGGALAGGPLAAARAAGAGADASPPRSSPAGGASPSGAAPSCSASPPPWRLCSSCWSWPSVFQVLIAGAFPAPWVAHPRTGDRRLLAARPRRRTGDRGPDGAAGRPAWAVGGRLGLLVAAGAALRRPAAGDQLSLPACRRWWPGSVAWRSAARRPAARSPRSCRRSWRPSSGSLSWARSTWGSG